MPWVQTISHSPFPQARAPGHTQTPLPSSRPTRPPCGLACGCCCRCWRQRTATTTWSCACCWPRRAWRSTWACWRWPGQRATRASSTGWSSTRSSLACGDWCLVVPSKLRSTHLVSSYLPWEEKEGRLHAPLYTARLKTNNRTGSQSPSCEWSWIIIVSRKRHGHKWYIFYV